MTARWIRNELTVVDEMAYVALPEAAAEYLFQIISGRAERPAVIATTNLPFSERTTMFPNAQLCKAMLEERWRVGKEASNDVVSGAFAVCDDGGS